MKLIELDKKRLILLDLDGTTLRKDGISIHKKNIDIIQKLVNYGHYICIITARPYRATSYIYDKLKLNTVLSNFDGSYIHHPKNDNFRPVVIAISKEIVRNILEEEVIQQNVDNILVEYIDKSMCLKQEEELDKYFHLAEENEDKNVIGDVFNDWNEPANNISFFVNPKEVDIDIILRTLQKYHNSIKIIIDNYSIFKDKISISISNKAVSKAVSAKFLAQYYNVDLRDAICFGDETNDIEMTRIVGNAVAMKNGVNILKSIAKSITYVSNDEGGVGDYLEKLIFENKNV